MLIIKKRNIQKGFSLIELMVAVVILAIAVLGIYQAYSVSFTGMADARDRTVATNYVREAMEGIKNMDFDKIITQSRSYITGTKYKYEREVIVQESTNLKKITTKVYWRNRNGNKKMVENGMSVHFMQTSEGTATRIMLIANPYNVLTGGTSTITAVVKDDKGNTVTTWTGDISFTSNSGGLQPNSVSIIVENVGRASTTFTAPSDGGEVNIMASASGLTPDSVNIKVTESKKPVKINLTANPTYMSADTSSTSEITATIVDADGETVTEAANVITFSVSGPGTLSAITSTAPTNGIATITLTSNGTPGTITVTVSATDLEPGVVNVFTGGKISFSASRFSVPVNETSEVTVTTKDVDGVPINYIGTINLIIDGSSSGSGNLSIDTLVFGGSTSSSNPITFTGTSVGIVNINAEDQAGILDEGSIELTITPALVPDHIAVRADPSIIQAGGAETSTITARVKTADNKPVISYNESVTFTTNAGSFSNTDSLVEITTYFIDGVATVELYSSVIAGVATITVCSPSISECSITGSTEVVFYIEATHIDLVANPQTIFAGGYISTITATIKDDETTVTGYSGEVEFSIASTASGEFTSPPPHKKITVVVDNGIAETNLVSTSNVGIVEIKATSSFTNSEGGTTEIEEDEVLDIHVISLSLVPHHIDLVANPQDILVGGETSTITATIMDVFGVKIDDYEGTVNFSITSGGSSGELISSTEVSVNNGIAVVTLQSTNESGIVTVKAEDSSLPNPSSTINITVRPITLILVDGSVKYKIGSKIITFNIEIDGPTLKLNSMKVEWVRQPSGELEEIGIESPSIAGENYDPIIDTGGVFSPYTKDNIDKDLLPGESTIRLTFSENMKDVPVWVTFYTDFGDFSIAF